MSELIEGRHKSHMETLYGSGTANKNKPIKIYLVTDTPAIWAETAPLKHTLVELQDKALHWRRYDGFRKLLQEETEQADRRCQISLLLQLYLLAAVVALAQPVYSLRVAVHQEKTIQVQLTWRHRRQEVSYRVAIC